MRGVCDLAGSIRQLVANGHKETATGDRFGAARYDLRLKRMRHDSTDEIHASHRRDSPARFRAGYARPGRHSLLCLMNRTLRHAATLFAAVIVSFTAQAAPMDPNSDPHTMEAVMLRFGTLFEAATSAMLTARSDPSNRDQVLFSAGSLMQDVVTDAKIAPNEAESMATQVRQALCGGAVPDDAKCRSLGADLDELLRHYRTPLADDPSLGDAVARLMAAVVAWADAHPAGALKQ